LSRSFTGKTKRECIDVAMQYPLHAVDKAPERGSCGGLVAPASCTVIDHHDFAQHLHDVLTAHQAIHGCMVFLDHPVVAEERVLQENRGR